MNTEHLEKYVGKECEYTGSVGTPKQKVKIRAFYKNNFFETLISENEVYYPESQLKIL